MGTLATAPPYLPPPQKTWCHHLSSAPSPLKLRKSHPPRERLRTTSGLASGQIFAPFAEREFEGHRLSQTQRQCFSIPSLLTPLRLLETSLTTTLKLPHLQKLARLIRASLGYEDLIPIPWRFEELDYLWHSYQLLHHSWQASNTQFTQQHCSGYPSTPFNQTKHWPCYQKLKGFGHYTNPTQETHLGPPRPKTTTTPLVKQLTFKMLSSTTLHWYAYNPIL